MYFKPVETVNRKMFLNKVRVKNISYVWIVFITTIYLIKIVFVNSFKEHAIISLAWGRSYREHYFEK